MTMYDEDTEVAPRQRKTIRDVMTVTMATKCGKSSKTHKLHVSVSEKVDRTRTEKSRTSSKIMSSRGYKTL